MIKDWEYGRLTEYQGIFVERIERIAAALEKIADKIAEKVTDEKCKGSTGGLF